MLQSGASKAGTHTCHGAPIQVTSWQTAPCSLLPGHAFLPEGMEEVHCWPRANARMWLSRCGHLQRLLGGSLTPCVMCVEMEAWSLPRRSQQSNGCPGGSSGGELVLEVLWLRALAGFARRHFHQSLPRRRKGSMRNLGFLCTESYCGRG